MVAGQDLGVAHPVGRPAGLDLLEQQPVGVEPGAGLGEGLPRPVGAIVVTMTAGRV